LAEAEKLLEVGGLKPAERRLRVRTFAPSDLAPDSGFWSDAFEGTQPRFMRPPPPESELIVGATATEFVLCLRADLPPSQKGLLLRRGAAHIALGHIRLGDAFAHADALNGTQRPARPRRWEAQVEEFLLRHATVTPPGFAVLGLTETLNRLVAGNVDSGLMSAALLLRSYADELVDIPSTLNERAHLFPHQKRGLAELIARLRRFNVALLADSVGLGKTRLACAIIRVLNDIGHITKAAIVTPRKLERNWRKELAVVDLREGDEVVLINKDILKRSTPQEAARAFKGFGLVIIEEAHQDLRNPGNRFHRNVRDGAGLAQGLLVTATPWNNRRGDIFAMLSPFLRPAVPGAVGTVFECFKKGVRTGRREFEESDEVFQKVYALTVLQRTRRQLRELGDAGVFYAPRDPKLDLVPYTKTHQHAFQRLLSVVEALRLPYFNPIRFLTSERDAEWRLSGTHRFFLLKRAESSMAAFRITLQGMQERARQLRDDLKEVADDEDAIGRWLAGTYRIAEDIIEAALDSSLEGGLLEERVTRPRQRRVLRLIAEATTQKRLRQLRKRLIADCTADIRLLDEIERDFADLFDADPKLALIRRLVRERVEGRKVLLVSQFADTAFAVYKNLSGDSAVRNCGIGLIMSTAKGGEAPVQLNGREATRDEVLWRFAPRAWRQNAVESGETSAAGDLAPANEVSVLVGTDTISVGQNLQDARTIFHLDLTWNPMVLEQRIGRLDRPRHESDNEPIEIRYFLNLDLIEAELELKKRIDARLEATYRDTAFDDEIMPGYFELIEKMRKLRAEKAHADEIAREVDALIEELAAARPGGVTPVGVDGRRNAIERLRENCKDAVVPEPVPPLVVTAGVSANSAVACAAQVEFQALDNNGRAIGAPESRLVVANGSQSERPLCTST
jgi:hypothetical protein